MGGEVLKVSIGLEVEAFGLHDPNRSNNVSPHSSSSHLNSSSGYSDNSLETTGVGSSADGVVLCHWNQVELCNLSRSRYLLDIVGVHLTIASVSFSITIRWRYQYLLPLVLVKPQRVEQNAPLNHKVLT
jgi:hypothetical protein